MANRWVCLSDKDISLLCDSIVSIYGRYSTKALVAKLKKSQKRIAIASAKGKARSLQQWVCRRISGITGIPYNQQDDQCKIHSREMGQSGVDIILRDEAIELFPFSIECKNSESFSLNQFMSQAISNQADGTDWMIVYRAKRLTEPVVIIGWDAFERIVRKG